MSEPARVLIVEDDENLRIALHDNLDAEGYRVSSAATGAEAKRALAQRDHDLVILDIMLPDTDGYALCRELRATGAKARVLMLTARTLEDDLLRGFEAGADDYLAKPYRLRELLARCAALLRRGASEHGAVIRFGEYSLDQKARRVYRADEEIGSLTRTEFDLLACLVTHRGCALTRGDLLDTVWGEGLSIDLRTVDNFVSSLKKKLGWTKASSFRIETIRGVGYRMEFDTSERR